MPPTTRRSARDPFAGRPHTPAEHFRLYFWGGVLHIRRLLGGIDAGQLPFLTRYLDELAVTGLDAVPPDQASDRWIAALDRWEESTDVRLPLAALRTAAGLDHETLQVWFALGTVTEDPRFGALMEALSGVPGQHRPTVAVLAGEDGAVRDRVRAAVTALRAAGLVETVDAIAPAGPGLRPSPTLWEAAGGIPSDLPSDTLSGVRPAIPADTSTTVRHGGATGGARSTPADAARGAAAGGPQGAARTPVAPGGFVPVTALIDPADLVLDAATQERFDRLAGADPAGLAVVVRGPVASGRRTFLRALARHWGRPVLERPADPVLGPLAVLLDAMPIVALDPPPGTPADLPFLPAWAGPLGVILPPSAALGDDAGRTPVLVPLTVPDRATREAHWRAALATGTERPTGSRPADSAAADSTRAADHTRRGEGTGLAEEAAELRMPAGTIRRVARLAVAGAALAGRPAPTRADLDDAARTYRSSHLDALATRVPAADGWDTLAVSPATGAELRILERRCRLREDLDRALPPHATRPGVGVRALFTGPSGTGKTLAARCLAGALRHDLYRLDLARVVDKYLGETEKNLDRVLRHAEALDVVLLLDEGDALLGRRTDVRSSNDRYANLETDYLLQRLEEHDGIVVVTTNAEQSIDTAFTRRLDVIVAFPAPGAAERHAVWAGHLPPDADVDPAFLTEVAVRCALTGGQIRNAVLHACLLALDRGRSPLTTADLDAAVRREYRKVGAVCPLRGDGPTDARVDGLRGTRGDSRRDAGGPP